MTYLINVREIDGMITERKKEQKKKCCGDLFADDIVLLALQNPYLKPF